MTANGEGQGLAGASGAAAVPQPIGVGPEMAALGRFCTDVTWKGTIHEGAMGPGTPAMTGVGRGKVQAIQDGRWIVLDGEQDQFRPDGTCVLRWQLHRVSGWSPGHGEYRAAEAARDRAARSCWEPRWPRPGGRGGGHAG